MTRQREFDNSVPFEWIVCLSLQVATRRRRPAGQSAVHLSAGQPLHLAVPCPRDAIADFAFPQPRRPKSVILPRASDRSKLVRITKPGLPTQRDITALPYG